MNEQLSSIIADVIKATKDGVVNIALFVQQQAPDLAKQIVSWGLWSSISEAFLNVITMVIIYKIWKHWAIVKWNENEEPTAMVFMVIGGIIFIIMFICVWVNVEEIIKCLVAPKLYLIEYIKNLIPAPSK
jgi:hypothetical protein